MKQNKSVPNLKQIKLKQVQVASLDTTISSSSSSTSTSSSDDETSVFVLDPDHIQSKPKYLKTKTESGKSLKIKVYDDQFKAQLSKLFEDGFNPENDDGLVFESGQSKKERQQAETHWNKTLLKLKTEKDTPKSKSKSKHKHKHESSNCCSHSHTHPHPTSTISQPDTDTQTRINEIIGLKSGHNRGVRGLGIRQGYQPNPHITVLNETCIKPLISFR